MKRLITPLAFILLAGPAFAQSSVDQDKRIADLEKKIEKLIKLDTKKEEPKDGGFSVKFGGRFHLDSTYFDGSENRLTNGTFMRRARISFKLGLGKDWVGEGDVDFAEAIVNIKDMWLGYTGFKNTLIQVGQFKQPFGMDTLGSSNATWLMERSYSDVWTPDRHMGVAVQTWGERWQAKVSFFGQAINDTADAQSSADESSLTTTTTTVLTTPTTTTTVVKSASLGTYKIVDDHGYGAAARVTFVPVMLSDTKAVHVGLAAVQRTPNAGAPGVYAVDFSGRPEQNKVAKEKFLSAAVTNVDKWTQTGVELAGVWNAFSWQGEYQTTDVKRRDSAVLANTINHKFSTYYGQVSWLFGGQRSYDVSEGLFGKVAPSKSGAWELVARYSKMNQNDLTDVDPVAGGEAKNTTFGLTYYLNKNVRFMLNYTMVDNGLNAKASKAYSPTGVAILNDDFSITSMRLQVNF